MARPRFWIRGGLIFAWLSVGLSRAVGDISELEALLAITTPEYRPLAGVWGESYQRVVASLGAQVTEATPGTDPNLALLFEFQGGRRALTGLDRELWKLIFSGEDVDDLANSLKVTSDTEFEDLADSSTYVITSFYMGKDAQSEQVAVVLLQNQQLAQAVAIAQKDKAVKIAAAGDSVPRLTTPVSVGTVFDQFTEPVLTSSHAVFKASGQNFTGVYARPFGGADLRVLAENFPTAPGSDTFGTIRHVTPGANGTVFFTAGRGIFSVSTDGTSPTLIAGAGTEYEPGKTWINPEWTDADGSGLVFGALDASFRFGIFMIDDPMGTPAQRQPKLIVGADTPVPGLDRNFVAVRNPLISNKTVIFEGFGRTTDEGVYAWSLGNVSPVIKRGDKLDGKTVNATRYHQGAFLGGTLAVTVDFAEGFDEVYILKSRGGTPEAAFVPGSIAYSPIDGFSAQFTGVPGTTYVVEYLPATLGSSTWWELDPPIRYEAGFGEFRDPEAKNHPSRLYRLRPNGR